MTALVVAEGIVRRFGEREVLRGVSFELRGGASVALLGPSGCGKTTLLQILGLLDRPTRGRLVVGGAPADALSERARAELRLRRFGFEFQNAQLLDHLTARENVALPGWRSLGSRRTALREADAWLERLGLAERAHGRASELSTGEAQRVAIARALVNGPDVVLADEPTGNLDSASARAVLDALFGLRGAGSALLVVTHDAAVAARADRILYMEDGTLRGDAAATPPAPAPAGATD